jgi:hypothetical protein
MNKKSLSERDICTKFITPAIKQAGWNILTQIREEFSFTDGRISNNAVKESSAKIIPKCLVLVVRIYDIFKRKISSAINKV